MTMMWTPKAEFPDLQGAYRIGIDCETKDPLLDTMGPGFIRRDGYVVGFSVSAEDREGNTQFKAYYPIRHEGGGNLDEGPAIRYLRGQLRSDIPKVGANIGYDLGWLRTEGIEVGGPKFDVLIAAPLLNENRFSYSLESVAKEHGFEGKEEGLLRIAYGPIATRKKFTEKDIKKSLWRFHSKYVGPYAETDAEIPLKILRKQEVLLHEQQLDKVWELETGLVDMLLDMKFQGVRVNGEKAEALVKKMGCDVHEAQVALDKYVGNAVDVWSNLSIAEACRKSGVEFDLTEKGNPTFTSKWMETAALTHPFFSLIQAVRKLDRAKTFIQNSILNTMVKGRVHCDFRQVKSDAGGTGTGRFSSSNPNLQQVPGRDEELGPLIRGLFEPDDGCDWVKADYAGQELRLTVHFAAMCKCTRAMDMVQQYRDNPDLDGHQAVADMCGIERKPAKTISLGLSYGMGLSKMAVTLGKTVEETERLFHLYHEGVPYVRELTNIATRLASTRGYVRTFLGRRRHFDKWDGGYGTAPLSKEGAMKEYSGRIYRAFTYRALNSVIQGSAGDMIKAVMLKIYQENIVLPYLTIHDELGFGSPKGDTKLIGRVKEVMEDIFPDLLVPMRSEIEIGPDWGHCERIKI